MADVTLTEEQARVWREAGEVVTVRGPDGRPMAAVDPVEAELMAKVFERRERRRTDPRPGIPGPLFHASFAALQAESERVGGFADVASVREFLDRFRADHG